jgi:hypothetical protein
MSKHYYRLVVQKLYFCIRALCLYESDIGGNALENTPLNPLSRGDLKNSLKQTPPLRGDLENSLKQTPPLRGDLENSLKQTPLLRGAGGVSKRTIEQAFL